MEKRGWICFSGSHWFGGELGVVGKEGLGWSTGVSDRELWEARELTWVSMGRTNKSRNGVSTFQETQQGAMECSGSRWSSRTELKMPTHVLAQRAGIHSPDTNGSHGVEAVLRSTLPRAAFEGWWRERERWLIKDFTL